MWIAAAGGSAARANEAGEKWGDVWVNVRFLPERPVALDTTTIEIVTLRGTPAESVDVGVIVPELAREAMFSSIQPLPAPATLQPDPAHPGRYAFRFVAPHSGLYRLRLTAAGRAERAQFEFPVWPRGRNPYIVIPIVVLTALCAGAVWWVRRQQAAA